MQHNAVVDAFREAGKKYVIEEKFTMTNQGADMYYQMPFPKVETEIAKGDPVRMMLTVRNSYSGHGSLQIVLQAMRLVCLNGMVVGAKFLQFNYRHMGSVQGFADANMID